MKFHPQRLAWSLAAVLWALQIYLGSSSSALQSEHTRSFVVQVFEDRFQSHPEHYVVTAIILLIRKTAHLAEFGILGVLVFGALGGIANSGPRKNTALWALAIAGVYAASDEIHQLFVGGRGASGVDWLIDMTGIAGGLTLVYWFCGKRFRELRQGAS